MMNKETATFRLALAREVRLSIQAQAEITSIAKSEPLLAVLAMAKEDAAAALEALAMVDPETPSEIRALQNRVARFEDLCTFVRNILLRGPEAEEELRDIDRAELLGFVISDDDAEALGIHQQSEHDDD